MTNMASYNNEETLLASTGSHRIDTAAQAVRQNSINDIPGEILGDQSDHPGGENCYICEKLECDQDCIVNITQYCNFCKKHGHPTKFCKAKQKARKSTAKGGRVAWKDNAIKQSIRRSDAEEAGNRDALRE